ncbi:HAD family hydrolase [Rhodophyticola sp. CCM32]|uniref:sulfotransferase-like domain-containing protein n=1 Tax=Rhodophyticola sp. CCM32 TaxID=2916397 RepID=UPI00107FA202|nr:HAD family hydrolase [Rhodophyticola sp. CCM32]QBY02124.1 HAD family hydrolase [Rhodophyticola sp. CCM32]
MKIAMWSGPRNLSTAMMYAFAARGDCAVWDEPFYAPYLRASGSDHPLAGEIIAAHEADPARVAARCAGPVPGGKAHFYMKHMPHHMGPGFPLDWALDCVNIHLIRHPARVIASYAAKRKTVTLEDIGFPQQAALYQKLGGLVIDSHDIRRDPAAMLKTLCGAINLPYRAAMLRWPGGGLPEDGIWARHWYGAVHDSTGFAGAEGPLPDLAPGHEPLLRAALPLYEQMCADALTA